MKSKQAKKLRGEIEALQRGSLDHSLKKCPNCKKAWAILKGILCIACTLKLRNIKMLNKMIKGSTTLCCEFDDPSHNDPSTPAKRITLPVHLISVPAFDISRAADEDGLVTQFPSELRVVNDDNDDDLEIIAKIETLHCKLDAVRERRTNAWKEIYNEKLAERRAEIERAHDIYDANYY